MTGRLRLDALARFLQDIATDDADDAGIEGAWVLRRLSLRIDRRPRYREDVELVTFCSGTGSRWAERRTQLRVDGRIAVESAGLWVCVDDLGRPTRLDERFDALYRESAGERTVSSRLTLPPPPAGIELRPWVTRASDFDLLGHMNNAAHWEAVEDELLHRAADRKVVGAQLEHRGPVGPDDVLRMGSELDGDALSAWLVSGADVRTSARISLRVS